jgi:hypothetical protein
MTWIWFNLGSPATALETLAQQTTAKAIKPTRPPTPTPISRHAMPVILANVNDSSNG